MKRGSIVFFLLIAVGAAVVAAQTAETEGVLAGSAQKAKEGVKEKKEKEKVKAAKTVQAAEPLMIMSTTQGSYLGVYLEEVTPERSKELGLREERGAITMRVVEGGPAEKAGLKENDVIVSFNGRPIDSVRELQRVLAETPPGRTVQIEVIRGGSRQSLNATLEKRSLGMRSFARPEINEEFLKRSEEMLKQSEEARRRAERAFDEFNFVGPGGFGMIRGTRLGITGETLTSQLADYFGLKDGKGVFVTEVRPESPAAKAGLQAADIITAVDGDKIEGIGSLTRALNKKQEGNVVLTVVRDRSERQITVTLEGRSRVVRPRARPRSVGVSA